MSTAFNSSNKIIHKKIVATDCCKHKTGDINVLCLKHKEHNGNTSDKTDGEVCCWQIFFFFFHVSNGQITVTENQLLKHTMLSEGGRDPP